MHKRLNIIIALLVCIIALMVVSLASCTTARGLHSNNIGRNTATRQAMQTDKDYKFVR